MCAAIENKRQTLSSGMRTLVVVGIVLAGAVVPSSDKANAATCIAFDFDDVGNRTARSPGPVAPMPASCGRRVICPMERLPPSAVWRRSTTASLVSGSSLKPACITTGTGTTTRRPGAMCSLILLACRMEASLSVVACSVD